MCATVSGPDSNVWMLDLTYKVTHFNHTVPWKHKQNYIILIFGTITYYAYTYSLSGRKVVPCVLKTYYVFSVGCPSILRLPLIPDIIMLRLGLCGDHHL